MQNIAYTQRPISTHQTGGEDEEDIQEKVVWDVWKRIMRNPGRSQVLMETYAHEKSAAS